MGGWRYLTENTELLALCQILWIIGIFNISYIFITIMTWIESLFMMKGRLLGQNGGNETEKVMINKLSPYKLILSLQNRFHADYVNFSILFIYFIGRVAPADFSTGALAR